jgi:tRNA (Thr-GGU) A37 N-methylase
VGSRDLNVGTEIIVLTGLDRASRDMLVSQPRGDQGNPCVQCSALALPIGRSQSGFIEQIVSIEDTRIPLRNLEALDSSPIAVVKPVLETVGEQ